MMKKTICTALIVSVIFSLTACQKDSKQSKDEGTVTAIHVDYPAYETAQEIVDSADLLFSGTVEKISYEMLNVRTETENDSLTGSSETQDIPYTIYEITVADVYKGSVEGNTISIKQPGGVFDGDQYVIDGAVSIEQGETYLFLTATYEDSYPSLLNVTQALYDLKEPELSHDGITLSQILDIVGQ